MTGTIPEPTIRQRGIQVLKIPPDGSAPHVVLMDTIDVLDEGNVDCFLVHIPDFRSSWGTGEGFHWRDVAQFEVRDQRLPELNGLYIGWRSFAMHLIPLSEHTDFCGDAFIVKLPLWENDEYGAVYEDFPITFVQSSLYGIMLEKMHDR